MSAINRDEWLRALSEAGWGDDDPSALTTTEFAEMFQISISTASYRLARLVTVGKATRVKKWCTNARGHRVYTSAFRLVDPLPPIMRRKRR